jgi:hypothetical protein
MKNVIYNTIQSNILPFNYYNNQQFMTLIVLENMKLSPKLIMLIILFL